MSGPLVAVLAAMATACTLLLALVRRHVPAEGLLPWLRESYRTVRADSARSRRDPAAQAGHREQPRTTGGRQGTVSSAVEPQRTGHVADLLEMGEDGPAYHRPPDLLERFARRRNPR